MWALLVAGFTFLGICNTCKSSSAGGGNNTDTVLLYKKDTLVVAGNSTVSLPCSFSKSSLTQFDDGLKTLLLLQYPVLVTLPEGVYELYITSMPPGVNRLSSEQPEFVTVLDLYSLTAPAAKQGIEVDISEHIKKLFLQNRNVSPVYISIRFGPIKLANGTYSSKAGELRFGGISIIQVKD